MHRHHPHQIALPARLALYIAIATGKPVQKSGEPRHVAGGVRHCGVDQFVNRIACFFAQARQQRLAPLPRPDQDPAKQSRRRYEIGA